MNGTKYCMSKKSNSGHSKRHEISQTPEEIPCRRLSFSIYYIINFLCPMQMYNYIYIYTYIV